MISTARSRADERLVVIDITRELITGAVYPGDTPPKLKHVKTFSADGSRLTDINMCLHNATHIDAPSHFLENGCDAAAIPLEKCIGKCAVVSDIAAAKAALGRVKMLLLRGCNLTADDAADLSGAHLIGIEEQSFGAPGAQEQVHKLLLGRGVVLLEGVDLSRAPDGIYTLVALPLKIEGAEGSPVRAALLTDNTVSE